MNELTWIIGTWYDLSNRKTVFGDTLRDLFLSMTTAEAVLYSKITGDKPFLVTKIGFDGSVMEIQRCDGKFVNTQYIEEFHNWSVHYIFDGRNRSFFEEVEAPEMELKQKPKKKVSSEEQTPLTSDKKSGNLDLSFLDGLHGLWDVYLVPTELGKSLGVGTYENVTENTLWAIDSDIRSSKVKLQDKIYELEKQIEETKELLFSI